jgi:hypothetical protein
MLMRIEQTTIGTVGSSNGTIASFKRSGAKVVGEASYGTSLNILNVYDQRKRLTDCVVTGVGPGESVKYRYDRGNRKRV